MTRKAIPSALVRWTTAAALVGCAGLPPTNADAVRNEAYALNREGMIAMSEARFDDAIDSFKRASGLIPDYGILGEPLMYTPVFMTGWASEKIGAVPDACASYRRFLTIAPTDVLEATKADHATEYLAARC